MAAKLCKRGSEGGHSGFSLPEDIIIDTLVRLPAKDLCRFRCVSKAWRAVISDPAFVEAQRSRVGPLIVAQFRSTPQRQRHELRLLDKDGDVQRVFEVSGTALLAPSTRLDIVFVERMQLLGAMIIDPASGRASTIASTKDLPPPWLPPKPNSTSSSTTALMTDYSFGRAIPSGDYKVLRLDLTSSGWYGPRQRYEVATIMDGFAGAEPAWRARRWASIHTSFCCKHKATANGVVYFMPHDTFAAASSGGRDGIAAFDLESEEWKAETIRVPAFGPRRNEERWSVAMTELKGALCMVHDVRRVDCLGGDYANIWLLVDPDKSVWIKEYRIHLSQQGLAFTRPLYVLGDGTTLLLLNAFLVAGNVVKTQSCHRYVLQFYNSSTEDFTDFMEMADGFNGRMAFYTGSLLASKDQ